MAQMSSDDERESKEYGDSSQLTNWILVSGATCHMKPEVTDFIPGSLEDTDKFIEVADGHHVTAKQKGSVRIQMCDDNGKKIVATLYNVLLAPDLCDRLFSIINVMIKNNLSHKSGARSTLYNITTNFFTLLSHICIRTEPFCLPLRDVCPKIQ